MAVSFEECLSLWRDAIAFLMCLAQHIPLFHVWSPMLLHYLYALSPFSTVVTTLYLVGAVSVLQVVLFQYFRRWSSYVLWFHFS